MSRILMRQRFLSPLMLVVAAVDTNHLLLEFEGKYLGACCGKLPSAVGCFCPSVVVMIDARAITTMTITYKLATSTEPNIMTRRIIVAAVV